MSAARRLKNSFQRPNQNFNQGFIKEATQTHFHANNESVNTEQEILKILSHVSHIKGKTLYQTIAELRNEDHPSRPLKEEINQIVWRMHSEKKIRLAEHPEKRGIKYATIEGFKAEEFNPKDAELLIEIVNQVPTTTWTKLSEMDELGGFRKSLCYTVAKIREDKVKILSHKQCYWALESLKFSMEEGFIEEEWFINNVSLDYASLTVLLADLRHFQD